MYVIHCAHVGIDSIGVNNPLIKIKIITKKNMTNMVCCMVDELLAFVTPIPDIVNTKSKAAR